MDINDEILINSIKTDDYNSYQQLFVRYYDRLCLYVLKIVQDESAAEDVVQELFIRLWILRKKIEITEHVSGYLYQSAKNAALNYLRSENTRQKNLQNMPREEFQSDDLLIEETEFNVALYQCIEQLPQRSREVFLMSRFESLKQKEIADKLGISIKTIKNQIWKSMQYLKACLELKDTFNSQA